VETELLIITNFRSITFTGSCSFPYSWSFLLSLFGVSTSDSFVLFWIKENSRMWKFKPLVWMRATSRYWKGRKQNQIWNSLLRPRPASDLRTPDSTSTGLTRESLNSNHSTVSSTEWSCKNHKLSESARATVIKCILLSSIINLKFKKINLPCTINLSTSNHFQLNSVIHRLRWSKDVILCKFSRTLQNN
jgi:hypothetical protein